MPSFSAEGKRREAEPVNKPSGNATEVVLRAPHAPVTRCSHHSRKRRACLGDLDDHLTSSSLGQSQPSSDLGAGQIRATMEAWQLICVFRKIISQYLRSSTVTRRASIFHRHTKETKRQGCGAGSRYFLAHRRVPSLQIWRDRRRTKVRLLQQLVSPADGRPRPLRDTMMLTSGMGMARTARPGTSASRHGRVATMDAVELRQRSPWDGAQLARPYPAIRYRRGAHLTRLEGAAARPVRGGTYTCSPFMKELPPTLLQETSPSDSVTATPD